MDLAALPDADSKSLNVYLKSIPAGATPFPRKVP